MSRVYVVNNSGHDYSMAEKFGKLIFLSEGKVNPFKVNNMYRQFVDKMEDSKPTDYILVTGLSQMVGIATSIQAFKFGKVNYLIYSHRDNKYVVRDLVIGNLIEEET